MNILGLNAFHGDASAALVRDGQLAFAIEEERLNRIKHCAGFPSLAVAAALEGSGISAAALDHVAISRDPRANLFKKVLYAARRSAGLTRQLRDRMKNAAKVRGVREALSAALGPAGRELRATLHNVEHHQAHIASAFFVSPFEEAACLSIDGFGDFVSTMLARGHGTDIEILDRIEFPHSAGLFYTAITQFIGFPHYGDEWKLMGLAPFGQPRYLEQMRQVIAPRPGGRFELDLSYFRHHSEGVEMTWDEGQPRIGNVYSPKLAELLGPPRDPQDPEFYGRWADIARSAQEAFEEVFFHVLAELHRRTGSTNLALAGGCALNSAANGKIYEGTPFGKVYAQAAAGDDGTAIGAAFFVEHALLGRPRRFVMEDACTGSVYSDAQITAAVEAFRAAEPTKAASVRRLEDAALVTEVASAIAAGKVVGWFQGRMEFGPRALGNRSIVADPRRAEMKDVLNERIKRRETFRPFAPSVLAERVGEVFERTEPSPFMLMVYKVRPEMRERIPAVTHVDGTGRLQTVTASGNPRYHALISEFARQTGLPLVLNTSFNEHEPIVASPEDALRCFSRTRLDVLAVGNHVLSRG